MLARRIWTSPEGRRATIVRLIEGLFREPRLYDAHEEVGQFTLGDLATSRMRSMRPGWRTDPGFIRGGHPVRSADQPLSRLRDPLMGWGKVAAGGVEVRTVGGSHDTLTREPYVRELAAQLTESLAAARDAVGAGSGSAADSLAAAPA